MKKGKNSQMIALTPFLHICMYIQLVWLFHITALPTDPSNTSFTIPYY